MRALRTPRFRLPVWLWLVGGLLIGAWKAAEWLVRFYVLGLPPWGKPTDNASWTQAATRDLTGRPTPRLGPARRRRAAFRSATTGMPLALTVAGASVGAPGPWWVPAAGWWTALALAAAGYGALRLRSYLATRGFFAEFIAPAGRVLAKALDHPYTDRWARQMVTLPPGWGEPVPEDELPKPVRIGLPPGTSLSGPQCKALAVSLGAVLGMPEPVAVWVLAGATPHLLLTPRADAPALVTWERVAAAVAAADVDKPVLGLAAGGRVITADYSDASPHQLISGASGTGKSVLMKALLTQRMHHGHGLVVLDYKRISHRWAHDLPGALYAWKIEDMHDLAVAIGAELNWRIANVIEIEERGETFTPVNVLVEEANILIDKLSGHWRKVKDSGDPPMSPAVEALKELIGAGREYEMFAHYAAQRASASIFGGNGGNQRESFSLVLLAKWKVQTWKMLAGGMKFLRWPGGARGLWCRLLDDEAVMFRVPFITDAQAREWAGSGVACPPTPLARLTGSSAQSIPSEPELVTLSRAVSRLPGPALSLDALRTHSKRSAAFPAAVGELGPAKTYDLDHLSLWKLSLDERSARRAGTSDPAAAGRALRVVSAAGRAGIVYRFDVLDEDSGAVVCGYVGQTVRALETREAEHRGNQPWADLIIGRAYVIWSSEDCTPAELDVAELAEIHRLHPLYNYEGQEGAEHAVPKYEAIERRQQRNANRGESPWVPVDVYNQRRTNA